MSWRNRNPPTVDDNIDAGMTISRPPQLPNPDVAGAPAGVVLRPVREWHVDVALLFGVFVYHQVSAGGKKKRCCTTSTMFVVKLSGASVPSVDNAIFAWSSSANKPSGCCFCAFAGTHQTVEWWANADVRFSRRSKKEFGALTHNGLCRSRQ
jgi:hypothetical protein